jgi:hypothetical protein
VRHPVPLFALTGGEMTDNTLADPMSQSLLASATAPHATSKHKTIELYNPSQVVEFKSTGTLTFKWSFSWEESVSGPFKCFRPFLSNPASMIQTHIRVETGIMLSYPEARSSCPCRDHKGGSSEVQVHRSNPGLQSQSARLTVLFPDVVRPPICLTKQV